MQTVEEKRAKWRAKANKYNAAHPEKHREYVRRSALKWREFHPEEYLAGVIKWKDDKARFGELARSQNKSCAICGHWRDGGRLIKLCPDRDPQSGEITRLLCRECLEKEKKDLLVLPIDTQV